MGGGGLTKALTIGGGILGAYLSGGATLPAMLGGAAIGASGGMAAGSLLDTPKAPEAAPPSVMTNAMGDVLGTGGGTTFSETEQTKQRGSVTKKRLGTKQLQIPLANANPAAGGVNTGTSTGVNV